MRRHALNVTLVSVEHTYPPSDVSGVEAAMITTDTRALSYREKSWPPSLLRRAWPSMAIAVALIANAIWIGLLGYAVSKLL